MRLDQANALRRRIIAAGFNPHHVVVVSIRPSGYRLDLYWPSGSVEQLADHEPAQQRARELEHGAGL